MSDKDAKKALCISTGRTCDLSSSTGCFHQTFVIWTDGSWESLGYKTSSEIKKLHEDLGLELHSHFVKP